MGFVIVLFVVVTILYLVGRQLLEFYHRPVLKTAILITGCDSGFGLLSARKFALHGIYVFAGCLTQEGKERLENEKELEGRITPFLLDVTSDESVKNAYKLVSESIPEYVENFSILNNAGIYRGFWFEATSVKDFERVIQVNCLGMVRVTHEFLPLVKKSKSPGARIINITSMMGRKATAGMTSYSCSKYAGEGFSDALRCELIHLNIPVVTIQPSYARTGIVSQSLDSVEKFVNEGSPILDSYPVNFKEKSRLTRAKIATILLDPSVIVDTLMHAYTVSFPKNHYPVGAISWIFVFLSCLPDEIGNYILAKIF